MIIDAGFSFSGCLALHVLVILPFQQKVSLISVKVSLLLHHTKRIETR
jgi:hypothetical protein